MSQTFLILEYMKKHGSITPKDAENVFGCMRLSGRIYDLKRMGVSIRTEIEAGVNRLGYPTRYARYSIVERGNENV